MKGIEWFASGRVVRACDWSLSSLVCSYHAWPVGSSAQEWTRILVGYFESCRECLTEPVVSQVCQAQAVLCC